MQHDGGQPVDRWFEADYWRALNPSCSVSECEPPDPIELSPAQIGQLRDRMDLDGYFDLSETVLRECADYQPLIRRLRGAVTTLVRLGWPASFVVVYDEAWILVQLLSAIMSSSTGGNS